MSSKNRKISYSSAINEALRQMMSIDKSMLLIGQGVKSPWYVGATTKGLLEKFGGNRVIDTPVSENAITGAAVGAAISGMRVIVVHPRMDFMFYAMDPIMNQAANWYYMSGGRVPVPLVIWAIINRGEEQAAQHSQALQAMFVHVPGLKVVMPSTPYDAKGLLVASIRDDNPVVYIDDRWLYNQMGEVPEELYSVPIGKGIIRREGKDVTMVASSFLVIKTLEAANRLKARGIEAEVIDLRSLKPLDNDLIFKSIKKTGRLMVVDGGWKTCGIAAEIICRVVENKNIFASLKAPVARVTLPDVPAPASRTLESAYYPDENNIQEAVINLLKYRRR